ncbi:MAG: helix-turn-helix transcriptional regulator [Planctomycetes bacterium]|nr:helix-turn-helix transcriptional regulator [Planctomycetota bacterium]
MYTFPELLKQIRIEGNLTQEELARALNVSTVLISMIETKQKEVSKNFLEKLANSLEVRPSSIAPFVFMEKNHMQELSNIERKLVAVGEKLQLYLIKTKSKKLKRHA